MHGCYELAFQAMKTRIDRLSFCVGVNSVVRCDAEAGDSDDEGIVGSEEEICVAVVPSSLEL